MAEHVSARQLDGYRRRTLSAEEVVAVAAHLAACEACRARAGSEDALAAGFVSLRDALVAAESSEAHLTYEDLEAHVDGRLDEADREVVAAHLEGCAECATDAADLGDLRSSLLAGGLLRGPMAASAAPSPPPAPARRMSWISFPARLLGTAAAAAVAAWAVSISVRSDMQALRGRLAELEGTNTRLLAALGEAEASRKETALLADGGGVITSDGSGGFRGLPDLPAPLAELVKGALSSRRVEGPARLADLGGRPETLMGTSEDGVPFALVQPLGAVVESERPSFRWRRLPGAAAYVVAVHDSHLRRVAQSPPLRGTEWAPARPLARGGVYSWQVTALRDGEEVTSPSAPAPEARFQVLGARELEELRRARAAYADWHVVMAGLYARAGLISEAEGELRALAAANPGSPLARDLLRSLTAQR